MRKYISFILALAILTSALPAQAGGVVCADFKTQAEAQRYFQAKKPSYKRPDRDKNGLDFEVSS